MPDFVQPIAEWLVNNSPWIILAIVMHMVVLGTVAFAILGERKVAAWAQDRVGPNRAGFGLGIIPILKNYRFLGLGQSFADGIKMLLKEDYRSPNADRGLFTLAPMIMMAVVIISIAVLPWGGSYGKQATTDITAAVQSGQTVPQAVDQAITGMNSLQSSIYAKAIVGGREIEGIVNEQGQLVTQTKSPAVIDLSNASKVEATYLQGWRFQIANLNVGVVFILAVLSLAVYGVVIGGYASNNKYSFLGGLRATANMISYEIPLGLTVLTICLLYGTFDLGTIVDNQARYWFGVIPAWNAFAHPLVFILFLICIHAEANRAPFDTAECEQELVGGYHTEYSSMRFGMFFLAEYAGMITTSAICVALFFGGWHVPWLDYVWPALRGSTEGLFAGTHVTDSLLAGVVRIAAFFTKTIGIMFIFMWVRWSVPRFRFDQIMNLAWKGLIPVSLGLLVATAVGVYVVAMRGGTTVNGLGWKEAILFAAINLVIAAITLVIGTVLKTGSTSPNKRIAIPDSRYVTQDVVAAS
jgi:NADH-quinone oxidoreductase subunit H